MPCFSVYISLKKIIVRICFETLPVQFEPHQGPEPISHVGLRYEHISLHNSTHFCYIETAMVPRSPLIKWELRF